jgi:hypothetical protein
MFDFLEFLEGALAGWNHLQQRVYDTDGVIVDASSPLRTAASTFAANGIHQQPRAWSDEAPSIADISGSQRDNPSMQWLDGAKAFAGAKPAEAASCV